LKCNNNCFNFKTNNIYYMAKPINTSWSPDQLERINARRESRGLEGYEAKPRKAWNPSADAEYIRSSYSKAIGFPSINPDDPEQVRKAREAVEKRSGGKSSIKTVSEMQGSGLHNELIDPLGYGYTVVQSEQEKQRYNPNSEAFKRESAIMKQRAIDEEMRRKNRRM
jgi:hypothetical protein